jgi:hypothetical protein
LNLEGDAQAIDNFFQQNPELDAAFGGIYLEHTAGVNIVLQLVRGYEHVEEIPAMLPTLQYPDCLQIELVDFAESHLEVQMEMILNAPIESLELTAIGINGKQNRVSLMIAPSDAWVITADGNVDKTSLPDDLAALVADPSVVVTAGEVQEEVE